LRKIDFSEDLSSALQKPPLQSRPSFVCCSLPCPIASAALPHSLTPSLPHSLTPSLPHSLTPSLTHSLTPSLPHSLTPSTSLTPSLPPSLHLPSLCLSLPDCVFRFVHHAAVGR